MSQFNIIEKPAIPEDLVCISVQPADIFRFYWELEIQMNNFVDKGIDPRQIHILLAYQPRDINMRPQNPPQAGLDFAKKYFKKFPNIHFYPDHRTNSWNHPYQPSIRPHVLKQHFSRFPELERSKIFYHDSDIIFNKVPDFNLLGSGPINYVSDTNSYLNADYVMSKGPGLLEEMCGIVGVSPDVVKEYNNDSGGSQYLLKNINASFWHKVELDSIALYQHMQSSIPKYAEIWAKDVPEGAEPRDPKTYHEIQAWCADMWAIFYGLLALGREVRVHKELEFSWATDSLETAKSKNIFHNAGVVDGNNGFFFKGDYRFKSPFNDNWDHINPNTGSWMYVQEFKKYVEKKPAVEDIEIIEGS